jgi:ribonuclease HII
MAQLVAEAHRLWLMRRLEDRLEACGYRTIAGVDEAGRGALAGPVYAAAVVVEAGTLVPGVDDSKQLSPAAREQLAAAIRRAHPVSAVAAASASEIDRVNVLEATRLAMRRAVEQLSVAPELVVIDAVRLPGLGGLQLSVVRGDQISYAVACASILAKVERDRLMVGLGRRFPQYAFASNKGYGAPEHRRALASFGPSPVHRLTFRSVLPRTGAGGG